MLFDLVKKNKTNEFISTLTKNNNFDVNSFDVHHNYLLSYAVFNNNIKIVSFLLKKGAHIDIYDNENRSLLFNIIKYNMTEMLNIFISHNKGAVCSNILYHSDKYGLYPVHYTILFKNKHFLQILLANMYDIENNIKKNIQIYDLLNNNLLMFSIRCKSYELCEILLKYVNINDTNHENNNALHEAVLSNNKIIVDMLIKKNININHINNFHKTCLYYINANIKNDIVLLLLSNNINKNCQDILGNTIIHELLLKNNDSNPNINIFTNIYNIVISSHNNKYHNQYLFDYNLINIDGNQPLHILLDYNNIEIIDQKIISDFIKNTDLNVQNNEGTTCLHLLFMNNLWKKYINLLCNKKLNIFIYDKYNKKPFDYVDPNDISICFDIVIKSYINQLNNKNIEYINKIDIICSHNNNKYYDKNISNLDEYVNTTKYPKNTLYNEICYDIIKKNIMDYYAGLNINNLNVTSYPITKKDLNLDINMEYNKNVKMNTFVGIKIDILFGILYMLKKYGHICYSPVYIDKKIYFDISWINNTLEIHDNIHKNIINFISQSKKKFMILPLEISINNIHHNNYLLYDRDINEIERFEPDGSHSPYGLNYNFTDLDSALYNYFNNINITYISPLNYLPKIGLQRLEIQEKYTFFDNNKFCALWCIWYIDMRITYYTLKRSKLIDLLISTIKYKKMSFKYIIRSYSEKITILRDTILNNINVNINDFINGFVTSNEYDVLHTLIKKEFKIYETIPSLHINSK